MKRGAFLKSLLGVIVAPKILSEINIAPIVPVSPATTGNSLLLTQLNAMQPTFYKELIEKYGSEDYRIWASNIMKTPPADSNQFVHFEKHRSEASTQ